MEKLIVTGGLGFIGSNLIEYLLNKGHFVINIDKVSYSSNFYNTSYFNKNKNYRFYKIDISNKKKVEKIIKKYKPKCIFNLAAETHVDRSIDNSENFIKSNILGVHSLLENLIKYKKILLIHISTDEVFGSINGLARVNEKYPYKPNNPYAATKASSDHLIRSYINTYNLKAIITNCSNNYGPRQNLEKFIPKTISKIIKGENIPVYGKGKNSREWIYVLDHCSALYNVYKRGKIGETYNIGSNKNLTNIEIIKKIIKICKTLGLYKKNSKIKFVKDRPGHDLRYALNSRKIKKQLNWQNKVNFNQGIIETITWYKNNQKFYKLLRNKKFLQRLGKKR